MTIRLPVLLAVASLALWLTALPTPVRAATCSATIDNLTFDAVDTLSTANADISTSVRVTCNSLLRATVCAGIGAGSGTGTTDGFRVMTGPGGATLRYQLYQDAARQVPWGSSTTTTFGTVPELLFGPGTQTVTRTLYGRVFSGQSASASGSYVSTFSGAQTLFSYGEIALGSCGLTVLGSVIRPSFTVSATVQANCLVTADDLNFGSRGVLQTAVTAVGEIRARCTPGTSYAVSLNENPADPDRREMRSSSGRAVIYSLFRNAQHSQPWRSTSPRIATGTNEIFPVYGRVLPQPTPPAGRYSDTVIVTVTY